MALGDGWLAALDLRMQPLDGVRAVRVGGRRLVVGCHEGRYFAMDRFCPHEHGDLSQARVVAGALKCPLHGFMYDLQTGEGVTNPRFNTCVHPARVEDGVLYVQLAPDAGEVA